jgi:hypothetical protein
MGIAWLVNFYYGYVYWYDVGHSGYYVRGVRP